MTMSLKMNRVLAVTAASSMAAALSSPADAEAASRPNILLILTDDLGYGDVSCFRGNAPWITYKPAPKDVAPIQTPCLDRLAQTGMMLTSFYANSSLCSPTRAAIMTGRYNHRTGIVNVLGQLGTAMKQIATPGETPFTGLSAQEITIARILKTGGYRTGAFGKWHLGPLETHHPMDYGFDTYVGAEAWGGDNFSMKTAKGTSYFYRDRKPVDAPGYWYTDVLADEAVAFMKQPGAQPFFAYLALTAPHLPYIGPNDREIANAWDEVGDKGPRQDLYQAYKEVVEAMDAAIGRIYEELVKAGLDQNTLIVFTSDNGPVDYGSCSPYRGRKTFLYEGGPRVPFIASWAGRIPAQSTSAEPAITMDLLPTFARLAGCPVPNDRKIDGVDLTALLTEKKEPGPRMLFWEMPIGVEMSKFDNRRWAVRDGKWKLLQERAGKALELYDLESDRTESKNVAAQHPEVVQRLENAFRVWKKDVYADCPYDTDDIMMRLRAKGIIKTDAL